MLVLLIPLILNALAGDETLATVDARPVKASQLAERYAENKAQGRLLRPRDLLEDLINDDLLSADGYARKLDKAPAVAEAAERARRKAAAEHYLEKELYSTIRIDDAQVKALFHETGDSVRLKLIVLATEADARAAIDRLGKGAKFEVEGKQSLDPAASARGGDLGDLSRGMLDPILREAAFSAPLNRVQGPIALNLGFGVMLVTGRHIADEKELPARRAQIAGFATEQAKQASRRHLLMQLRGKYKATLDEDFLRSTGSANSASPQEADRVIGRAGDLTLRYGELLARMVRAFGSTAANSHASGFSVKRELALSDLDQLVLEVAAMEGGHGKSAQAEAAYKSAQRSAVIAEVALITRASSASPTLADLEAYLASHAAEFTRPPTRTCSQLVLKTKEQAAEIRGRLAKGERLEDLAAKVSIDRPTAARGGLLGTIDDRAIETLSSSGRQPALAAAIRSTKPNEVSEPTQTRDGWHLIRCSAPTPSQVARLSEVQQVVTQRLLLERGDEAVRAHLKALRSKAKVAVAEAAVQRAAAALTGGAP